MVPLGRWAKAARAGNPQKSDTYVVSEFPFFAILSRINIDEGALATGLPRATGLVKGQPLATGTVHVETGLIL